MKILQVCPRYSPQVGGVERHVQRISERLAARGHEVTVHTADAGGDGQTRDHRNGVRIRRHAGLAPGGAFHFAPTIAMAVRRATADVVHAHNYHSLPLLFAAMGTDESRFVATPHYHGASASPRRDRLLRWYRPIGARALRHADVAISVSQWESDRLRDDFGVDATVVPNGIDLDRFEGATPHARDRPYLLCVGRLEAYKGIQHAIRALEHLDGYDLLVAGDGPYAPELKRVAAETGTADRVEFLGHVDEDRLPALYAGAAACLSLSEFEAFGLTVGEALAAGTPCLVRNAGALAEWTAYDGCVGLDDVSPASIAEILPDVIGRSVDATGLLDWDDVTDRLEAIYERPSEVER